MKTESKTKGSSFRPSQNADGISANHHAGINRLVKLSLVVEGKIIKYYKHFTLKQKRVTTTNSILFLLTMLWETGRAIPLKKPTNFWENVLQLLFPTKILRRVRKGILSGYYQSRIQSGKNESGKYCTFPDTAQRSCWTVLPHIQSFGGSQPVNMGIIAKEVIQQGIDKERFDIRVDTNDYSQIIYSSQYSETHYNYLSRMAEAYGEQFYYDGEVLHFGKLPPQNKPIKLYTEAMQIILK